jgi:hypothetical protein
LQPAIHELKKEFFNIPHLGRTRKHLPDPMTGSAAKKINMFLRIIKVAVNQSKLVHLDGKIAQNDHLKPE